MRSPLPRRLPSENFQNEMGGQRQTFINVHQASLFFRGKQLEDILLIFLTALLLVEALRFLGTLKATNFSSMAPPQFLDQTGFFLSHDTRKEICCIHTQTLSLSQSFMPSPISNDSVQTCSCCNACPAAFKRTSTKQ